MQLVHFKPNEVIVKQGDTGDSFFHILTGIVKIMVSKKLDFGVESGNNITIDKYLGDLKAGQAFGELSLLYGTKRSATIVAVTNASLIKIDKPNFDAYVRDIFDNMLKDQLDFMKICPIFKGIKKETLIELGIRTERKKYITNSEILSKKFKTDSLFIIRRGVVKVVKTVAFVKDDNVVRKRLSAESYSQFGNKVDKSAEEEKVIEMLAKGPTKEDFEKGNVIYKDITLESMKMGDVFPAYFAVVGFSNENDDLSFVADSPCELISMKLSDLQEAVPEAFKFLQQFAKPYPGDDFIRKFFFYNSCWLNFKKTLKKNIVAEYTNRKLVANNNMRTKFTQKKDLNSIKLPPIFNNKSLKI